MKPKMKSRLGTRNKWREYEYRKQLLILKYGYAPDHEIKRILKELEL